MPKDTEKELQRLESWLLAEEEEEAPREPSPAPLDHYGAGCNIYNSDRTDEDLDAFSEEVFSPQKNNLTGLTLLFVLLCLGIVCVLLWWLLRWKGVIG